jgi:hypothetical protein
MGLEKDIQIAELYDINHRWDSKTNRHYPWENNLLQITTSSYLWMNPNMNEYLTKIQKILVLMLEQMNYARNFFNFTVHKYYNDHWG